MTRITHPLPIQGEVQANGLTFIDGVAETDADLSDVRPMLEEHGFVFDGEAPPAPATAADDQADGGGGESDGSDEGSKEITAEKVDPDVEITAENAGIVQTADGVEHVGEIPAEAPDEDAAG